MRAALRDAGIGAEEVGYCNAHGTATKVGDGVECAALNAIWGEGTPGLRVSSTKSVHGHLLGATGALEALLTTLALHQRRVPPTANSEQLDDECAVNHVREGVDAPDLCAAISNSFAFGGTNATLVLRRFDA